MATLTGEQLKDSYQSLVTIGDSITSDPTSGVLENGKGNPITSLTIAGTTDATLKIDSNRSDIILSEGDTTDENTLIRQQSSLFRIDTVADDFTTATRRFTLDHSSGDISFRDTSTNEAFYWDASTARLGLGTTSPISALHVVDTSNDIQALIGSATAGIETGVRFFGRDTLDTTNKFADIKLSSDDQTLDLYAPSSGTPSIVGLSVKQGGNVGIGTTSPSQVLSIESSSAAPTRATITNTGNASAGAGVQFITKSGGSQVSNATVRTDNAGNFSIFTGTTSESEKMRIDSSGNVLVGTSTAGTMSGGSVIAFGSTGGIIENSSDSVADNGTLDIAINTSGGGYQGFLIVSNTVSANVRTHKTFSVFGRGTDSSIQEIASDNGTSGSASFTVTTPSNGVIRVTNTCGFTTAVRMQFFGGTSF